MRVPKACGGESQPLRPGHAETIMPETTQASGIFTGKADVAWDTTKEGLPQGSITLSGRNVQVTQTVNDAALPWRF